MAELKIKGIITKKTKTKAIIQSQQCSLEIKKDHIKSPKWEYLKSGQEVTLVIKENANINVSIPLKDIIDAKAKGIKVIAGIDPYCRCDCYCVC
mgnify:CR=1 FL=1